MALNGLMAAVHSPQYRTLASLSRINLLHALQHGGFMTIEQLAAKTGLHRNTAREHLHRLVAAGFVHCESEQTAARGRPRILYSAAVPRDDPIMVEKVRVAVERARQVRRLMHVDEAGHDATGHDPAGQVQSGEQDATPEAIRQQLDLLDDHMDQCGFDSTLASDGRVMTVHDCPFSELARENPQVCEVHFGLVQETLVQVDGPLEAERLHPFSDVGTCTLELCAARRQ